jgi:hypothetical protein
MAPKYINIFRATVFISLFCIVSTPWNIIKNASGLLAFLSGYSCLMGPLAGEWMLSQHCTIYVLTSLIPSHRHHGLRLLPHQEAQARR